MSTSPIIDVRLCGNVEVPLDLRSSKNAIRIRFKTNSVNSSTGFNISYTAGIIPKSFLLIVDSGAAMFRLDPDVFSYTRLPIQNLQSPVAIDYDPEEDRVYWTDIRAKEIRSAFLNGTNNQLIFSLHPGASCEGLAIDYLSRLVFYTDSGSDVIGSVSISNLKQQTVINSDLDQPGAIALHLTKRFIFWASSGTSPKLERANYDGSERRALLTLSSQSRLAGLAVDLKNDLLYWADAAQERIERIDLQGGNRKPIFHLPQSRFFALALSGDYIFVTNLNSSLSTVLRVRIDASESTYKGWSTTSTLKGLCFYNESTRLRAENQTNITSSKTGLIAGVTGGCLAGLVIVISVVVFVIKRRGKRTPPAVRELPRAPVEWKSRSSTSSQVPLDKAVDYGKGDGDYGDYCELDDVQRQFSSVQRYVTLNQYLTPRPDYEEPLPPPPPSSSDPRSSRQGSTNVKI
ncbi:low-density lipoprotein receptor-related protein 8-like isoform X2 [Pomacea canaliculata]|uniref:low-density lipoprotein receptor-related protein 8-like isoform X2 n=1 Tax=Pomacea canaliculata TaxID=400727 RepID=UPI000D72DFD5|nr:low-density lipoprotein receptor-related protein 8-like isoform X2 [Pomacea canaliculata]